ARQYQNPHSFTPCMVSAVTAPSWIRRATIAAAAAGTLALWLFLVLHRQRSEWTAVYVRAARTLVSGGDLYGPGVGYPYPPFAATLAIVCVPFSEGVARFVWFVLNILAVAGLVWATWHATGMRSAGAGRGRWAIVLCLSCAGPYVLNALAHQQVDGLIAALAVASAAALVGGRHTAGRAAR